MAPPRRILFVCLGNICRSPAAEGVMRALAPALELDSCGTGGWHVGEAPYAPMQEAARARGYDLSRLRARQVSADDFARFDLILCMDGQNLRDVEAMRPKGAEVPVRLFTDFVETGETAVPDPYYTRDFDGALDLIERCARGLISS
ncbi:low molecular weight protein-tyrosine-phosphatase [Primorskyibacter flagellatus]|nr:low molecular weight protein-tyrosine-phosphatase [Primorskyibacter flagellatus]